MRQVSLLVVSWVSWVEMVMAPNSGRPKPAGESRTRRTEKTPPHEHGGDHRSGGIGESGKERTAEDINPKDEQRRGNRIDPEDQGTIGEMAVPPLMERPVQAPQYPARDNPEQDHTRDAEIDVALQYE